MELGGWVGGADADVAGVGVAVDERELAGAARVDVDVRVRDEINGGAGGDVKGTHWVGGGVAGVAQRPHDGGIAKKFRRSVDGEAVGGGGGADAEVAVGVKGHADGLIADEELAGAFAVGRAGRDERPVLAAGGRVVQGEVRARSARTFEGENVGQRIADVELDGGVGGADADVGSVGRDVGNGEGVGRGLDGLARRELEHALARVNAQAEVKRATVVDLVAQEVGFAEVQQDGEGAVVDWDARKREVVAKRAAGERGVQAEVDRRVAGVGLAVVLDVSLVRELLGKGLGRGGRGQACDQGHGKRHRGVKLGANVRHEGPLDY